MSGGPGGGGVATTVDVPVKDPAPGQTPDAVLRVEPGHPERSALVQRMASRWAALQMPPLGTDLVDEDALDTGPAWIAGSIPTTNPDLTRRDKAMSQRLPDRSLLAAAALAAAGRGAGRTATWRAASTWSTTSGCNDCHTPLAHGRERARSPT